MALNKRQLLFCEYQSFLKNGTASAIKAGYSKHSARRIACQLLKNHEIVEKIKMLTDQRLNRIRIDADRVLRELSRVAFVDSRQIMGWGPDGVALKPSSEIDDDAAAAVSEVSQSITVGGGSIKVKLHDKIAALKLLGQHLGLFEERLRITDDSQPKADLSKLTNEELAEYERLLNKASSSDAP